jgi:hypothetical protein
MPCPCLVAQFETPNDTKAFCFMDFPSCTFVPFVVDGLANYLPLRAFRRQPLLG